MMTNLLGYMTKIFGYYTRSCMVCQGGFDVPSRGVDELEKLQEWKEKGKGKSG
jgi:hypothetical protein